MRFKIWLRAAFYKTRRFVYDRVLVKALAAALGFIQVKALGQKR